MCPVSTAYAADDARACCAAAGDQGRNRISRETAHPVPVYFGLELVRHPGVVDITPDLVREMVQAGRQANAAGLVISWDLMHAPTDGIEALATETL